MTAAAALVGLLVLVLAATGCGVAREPDATVGAIDAGSDDSCEAASRRPVRDRRSCAMPPRPVLVILPLGDSLTRGWLGDATIDGGYRVPLGWSASSEGYTFSQVGPYTDNGLAHAGLNGRDLAGLVTNIPGLGVYGADVVILIYGTPDTVSETYDGATSAANLATALALIDANWPDARLVINETCAALTGQFAARAPNVTDLDSRIGAVLDASPQHADGRMRRFDLGAIFDAAAVSDDGAHPNSQASYDELAAVLLPLVAGP
jgi:hypothetical protein